MRPVGIVFGVMVLLTACVRLPTMIPDPAAKPSDCVAVSRNVFPTGRWQIVHSIEAAVPGGKTVGLIGVSVLSSGDRTVQCALMTVEGLVLFSARDDGQTVIERALPPLDRDGFAEGLVRDLRLLFFEPPIPLHQTGRLSDHDRLCRYRESSGEATDVVMRSDGSWALRKYGPGSRLERSIEAWELDDAEYADGYRFPKRMLLKGHGLAGYTLKMTLVEAIPLTPQQ